jgi:hypothetical protein
MLKYTIIILNQFNIKKIKFTKTILKILITKKNIGNDCSNPQCFKEKKIQNKILNQLNIKKIEATKIILKKNIYK